MQKKLKHEYVTLEHLLYAMLCEETFAQIITGYGSDVDFLKKNIEQFLKTKLDDIKIDDDKYKPKKTGTVERVLNRAFTQVLFSGRNNIEISDVFLSMLSEKKSYSAFIIQNAGIEKAKFADYISSEFVGIEDEDENIGIANKALKDFTDDLNTMVKAGKIDPVIGRNEEIEQVALALGRRTKSNVLMVGDPGVGKTAIAEGLAWKIVNDDVPDFLADIMCLH